MHPKAHSNGFEKKNTKMAIALMACISKTSEKFPVIIRYYNHCKDHKYYPDYESSERAAIGSIRWEVMDNIV